MKKDMKEMPHPESPLAIDEDYKRLYEVYTV